MKRILKNSLLILLVSIVILGINGCSSNSKLEGSVDDTQKQKVVKATLNDEGNIVINEDEITEIATFLSYEVDNITIGFIVVRGTDGKVRVAFNTCQSCSPSPNAYFVQKGEYFECQNCGNKFHVDQIGIEKGGCNPAPVEEMTKEDGIITISSEYVETYKENFENWNGPKA